MCDVTVAFSINTSTPQCSSSVLQSVAVSCNALQCVAVCRSVSQCVAVCYSLLTYHQRLHSEGSAARAVHMRLKAPFIRAINGLRFWCCSVLQCVAMRCNELQCADKPSTPSPHGEEQRGQCTGVL